MNQFTLSIDRNIFVIAALVCSVDSVHVNCDV